MKYFDLPEGAQRRPTPNTKHGPECPMRDWHHSGIACHCIACHCPQFKPTKGAAGACGHCHRPFVKNGKVVRVYA